MLVGIALIVVFAVRAWRDATPLVDVRLFRSGPSAYPARCCSSPASRCMGSCCSCPCIEVGSPGSDSPQGGVARGVVAWAGRRIGAGGARVRRVRRALTAPTTPAHRWSTEPQFARTGRTCHSRSGSRSRDRGQWRRQDGVGELRSFYPGLNRWPRELTAGRHQRTCEIYSIGERSNVSQLVRFRSA
jgi:hypothetical protein